MDQIRQPNSQTELSKGFSDFEKFVSKWQNLYGFRVEYEKPWNTEATEIEKISVALVDISRARNYTNFECNILKTKFVCFYKFQLNREIRKLWT